MIENNKEIMHYFYKIYKNDSPFEVTIHYFEEQIEDIEPKVLDYAHSKGASQVYRHAVYYNGRYKKVLVYSHQIESYLDDVWASVKNLADIDLDYVLDKLGYEEAEKISIYGLNEYPNLEKCGDIEKLVLLIDKYRKAVYEIENANISLDNLLYNTK